MASSSSSSNSTDVCAGCELNFYDTVLHSKDYIKEELLRHGIWRDRTNCGRCGNSLVAGESGRFRCGKLIRRGRQRAASCNWSKSIWSGTFFEHASLPLVTVWRFIHTLLIFPPPRQTLLQQQLGLSPNTVVDWLSFYREVLIHDAASMSEKLGGKDRVVEISEAKFGKPKVNTRRIITGEWIFVGIERESRRTFFVPVESGDGETLLTVLKEWVLPGTTVVSDCWKTYDCLQNEDFRQLTVNHSYNFVNSQTSFLRNNVQRKRRKFCSNGQRKVHIVEHLAEHLFKMKYPKTTRRLHYFLLAVARFYQPDY
ncbi:uncharacterized protein LOC111623467 [Centruroides sculpturatus]|uniref:uncharacterized protein LOC111623451 n=1 Tax=Centruroides sculpturatus TaxID=218467 RepID=UPI000C6CF526|nr:uncharacterized protein LOC111623451 [Centruroides sculpturatus]XP_023221819.1 uncharacterized protein LOC111623467 [Centruroides sculpturatus]